MGHVKSKAGRASPRAYWAILSGFVTTPGIGYAVGDRVTVHVPQLRVAPVFQITTVGVSGAVTSIATKTTGDTPKQPTNGVYNAVNISSAGTGLQLVLNWRLLHS